MRGYSRAPISSWTSTAGSTTNKRFGPRCSDAKCHATCRFRLWGSGRPVRRASSAYGVRALRPRADLRPASGPPDEGKSARAAADQPVAHTHATRAPTPVGRGLRTPRHMPNPSSVVATVWQGERTQYVLRCVDRTVTCVVRIRTTTTTTAAAAAARSGAGGSSS